MRYSSQKSLVYWVTIAIFIGILSACGRQSASEPLTEDTNLTSTPPPSPTSIPTASPVPTATPLPTRTPIPADTEFSSLDLSAILDIESGLPPMVSLENIQTESSIIFMRGLPSTDWERSYVSAEFIHEETGAFGSIEILLDARCSKYCSAYTQASKMVEFSEPIGRRGYHPPVFETENPPAIWKTFPVSDPLTIIAIRICHTVVFLRMESSFDPTLEYLDGVVEDIQALPCRQ